LGPVLILKGLAGRQLFEIGFHCAGQITGCAGGFSDGGQTNGFHGATFAFFRINGWWRFSRLKNLVHAGGEVFDRLTEWLVEDHHFATLCLAIEDGSNWNWHVEHLFEAKRLCTKLNSIGQAAVLVASPLVLHRIRLPESFTARHGNTGLQSFARQKLDNIGLPRDAKAKGPQRKSSPDQNLGTGFNFGRVCLLVEKFAFSSEEVLLPLLLQMNQRPAPFAEGEMLETGEREEILF